MTRRSSTAKPLAEQLEEKRESKRLAFLRKAHPELEIVALTSVDRVRILELQEEQAADWQNLGDELAALHGVTGQGYTLQVSEGVFTRPRKESPAPKRGRQTSR